jgi:hypothetical protein
MTDKYEKFKHYVGNTYEFLTFYCNCLKALYLGLAIQHFSASLSLSIMAKIYMAKGYFNCTDMAKEHLSV